MRRLVVNLDNTLDEWLKGYKNQNEIVRNALTLYKGDIKTDTVQGLRIGFHQLNQHFAELEQRFIEQYEMVEELAKRIEELYNR